MKSKNLTYEFHERYLSIEPMIWRDVPPFAMVTGENGAGKTHLLELLAASYGAPVFDSSSGGLRSSKIIPVSMLLDGKRVEKSHKAIYVHDHQPHQEWGSVSIDAVAQRVHQLYEMPRIGTTGWQDNSLFSDWTESEHQLPAVLVNMWSFSDPPCTNLKQS